MDTKDKKIAQKTDLLKFQQTLNDQFLEILSQKNDGSLTGLTNNDSLGLSTSFKDVNMFISLRDLKSIATKLKYENSVRTKSWVLGFNQDHGSIYTIFNLNKVFNLFVENKTDFDVPNLNINSNILYIKPYNDEHYGLLLNEFKLDYTAEFTPLFSLLKNQDTGNSYWEIGEEIDFHLFLKKENMTDAEWELVNIINQYSKTKQEIVSGEFPEYNEKDKYSILALLVNRVYLDAYGQKPIFALNLENLTKCLKNISPF